MDGECNVRESIIPNESTQIVDLNLDTREQMLLMNFIYFEADNESSVPLICSKVTKPVPIVRRKFLLYEQALAS